jgi:vancomycin resistance protein YoaR
VVAAASAADIAARVRNASASPNGDAEGSSDAADPAADGPDEPADDATPSQDSDTPASANGGAGAGDAGNVAPRADAEFEPEAADTDADATADAEAAGGADAAATDTDVPADPTSQADAGTVAGTTAQPVPAEKPRPRAPRFPPGAARPGEAELPPAYGGSLGAAAAGPAAAGAGTGGAGSAAADAATESATGARHVADADPAAESTATSESVDQTLVGAPVVAGSETGESDDDGGGKGSFFGKRPVIIAGAVIAGLLVLYGISFAVAGSSLARNASVLGVDVGGMSPAEAEATLTAELPPLVDEPIAIESGDDEGSSTLVPSEAGLTVDVTATVAAIPGGSANPISLVRALFGGGDVEPIPAVDRAALTTAVEGIGEEFDVEPVNGSVAFSDGDVVTSEAEPGASVDVEATADLLEAAYFGAEDAPAELPIGPVTAVITEVEAAITDAEVARAVAEFAEPAMSAPVSVVAGGQTIDITPEILSQALTMVPDGRVLEPVLDPDDLAEAAHDVLSTVGEPGNDATIEIRNGEPTIIPESVGVGVVPEDLAEALLPVLVASGDERSAEVEFDEVQPDFTAADAEALGVKEVVSEFTTEFVPSSYRNTNIGLAASKINNTLLMPGDTFSLNGLVGERTAANGFVRGGVISGGQLVEAYGGGVSQVATTTYHAAFKAGLEDVEHRPHSIYYSHYPVGQEATVSWGNFDMAFKNDTPYGVLVETQFRPSIPGRGSLTVRIWSTEHFKVETSTSDRSNFTDPGPPTYSQDSNCFPNSPSRGFSITSYRKVWDPDGNLVKDEADPWTYRPSPEVICGPEPDDD